MLLAGGMARLAMQRGAFGRWSALVATAWESAGPIEVGCRLEAAGPRDIRSGGIVVLRRGRLQDAIINFKGGWVAIDEETGHEVDA